MSDQKPNPALDLFSDSLRDFAYDWHILWSRSATSSTLRRKKTLILNKLVSFWEWLGRLSMKFVRQLSHIVGIARHEGCISKRKK